MRTTTFNIAPDDARAVRRLLAALAIEPRLRAVLPLPAEARRRIHLPLHPLPKRKHT